MATGLPLQQPNCDGKIPDHLPDSLSKYYLTNILSLLLLNNPNYFDAGERFGHSQKFKTNTPWQNKNLTICFRKIQFSFAQNSR
jgi:hypothetical protein